MKIPTNKKHNLSSHKIAVLSYMLISELNDIGANSVLAKEIIDKGKAFENALEPMIDAVFESKEVSRSTYLNQLAYPIDTIIRKNYQRISE